MQKYFYVLFFVLSIGLSHASPRMFFVHLKAKDSFERTKLARLIHLDTIVEDSVYSVVNEHDYLELKKNVPEMMVESHEHVLEKAGPRSRGVIDFPDKDSKYSTYEEVKTIFNDLSKKFPKIARTISIGKSVMGQDILALRITNEENIQKNYQLPGFVALGSHHAREHLSTEVPLLVGKHIVESYDKDPKIKKLVDERDIYIIPVVNPDGKNHDIEGKQYKLWRKNRSKNGSSIGVDLNRNYDHDWGLEGSSKDPSSDIFQGPVAFSEPESQAVKKFFEDHPLVRTSISYHSFSAFILYPWGARKEGVGGKDESIFKKMATEMAKSTGYKAMQSGEMYLSSGDTCDWAYDAHGVFCFTFELPPKGSWLVSEKSGFYPGSSAIDPEVRKNITPVLYLIEKAADPSKTMGQ